MTMAMVSGRGAAPAGAMTRWRILGLLFLARVGLGLQFQTLGSVGRDLSDALGASHAEIGVLIGLFMVPGIFLALPAGLTGRVASDRVLAAGGLAVLAAGGVVSGLASEGWTIGAGRVLSGAGFVFASLYFTKMVADWFDGREMATAMSVLVMSWPFGIAMGQVGHAWLAGALGWRAPFMAASGWCLLAALAVLLVYRPPAAPVRAGAPVPGRWPALSGQEWRLILCAGAAWGLFNAGYVVFLSFGPGVLEARGMAALGAAAVISLGSWLMILSGTLCGGLADRTGRRFTILAMSMAGAVAAMALLAQGAGAAASVLLGLVGMAPAGVIVALAGAALRPDRRALGMGVFLTVYYAITMAAAPLAGALTDLAGDGRAALGFGALLFAAVVPAAWPFRGARRAG